MPNWGRVGTMLGMATAKNIETEKGYQEQEKLLKMRQPTLLGVDQQLGTTNILAPGGEAGGYQTVIQRKPLMGAGANINPDMENLFNVDPGAVGLGTPTQATVMRSRWAKKYMEATDPQEKYNMLVNLGLSHPKSYEAIQTQKDKFAGALSALDKLEEVATKNWPKNDSGFGQQIENFRKGISSLAPGFTGATLENQLRLLPKAYAPLIRRAMGDVGNMSEQEQRSIIEILPNIFTGNRETALNNLKALRKTLYEANMRVIKNRIIPMSMTNTPEQNPFYGTPGRTIEQPTGGDQEEF